MNLEKILQEKFSYTSFREGQKEIIQSVLKNQHTLALLPTGTGKSLCYQLPGYVLDGVVVIVSPLLSLMQDQVEQMRLRGEKRVVAINSFLSTQERKMVIEHIHQYKFIYISPEMIQSERIQLALQRIPIALLVVDEAHCISQWGFDFRPDYLELGKIRNKLNNPITLALTATAREDVRNDIKQFLQLEQVEEYIYSMDRKNIALKVEKVTDIEHKIQRTVKLVEELNGPGIIYFSSKKMADEMANLLNEKGLVSAASYHAGIDSEMRILLQQQFLYGSLDVMCATSAFGMGINKENVRYVIHFHPPITVESYLQEIGRAGRDGLKSIAIMLYTEGDLYLQNQLIEGELPNEMQIDYFLQLITQQTNVPQSRILPPEGFSDVQWRILWKYYQTSSSPIDFKQKMQLFTEQRLTTKKNKLQEITEWIFSEGCRREKLLNYFAEEKKIEVENCCDHCGIVVDDYKKMYTKAEQAVELDWQKRLAMIFPLKSEEREKIEK